MVKRLFFALLSLLALLPAADVHAQCVRVGRVIGVMPGCGATITDLDSGQSFFAVSGAEALSGGQTFTFEAAAAVTPAGCPNLYPAISLTCVSETLPCKANFTYIPLADASFAYQFEAAVYDAALQSCHWNFGDGTEGTGQKAQHTYAAPGEYAVCLTVSDAQGCHIQECHTVQVQSIAPPACGWDIQVTAVDKLLQAKLLSRQSPADYALESVVWYTNKSSQVIANTPVVETVLPHYGTYSVCAVYKTRNVNDGSECENTLCRSITVAEQACTMPAIVDLVALCPSSNTLNVPVCGCNGITYTSECEAMAAGVSTWWAGACGVVSGSCETKMDVSVLSGNIDNGFTVQFKNLSSGNFNFVQLDFGDGSDFWEGTNWSVVTHTYAHAGIYKANLTVWNTSGCISSMTQLVVTDAQSLNEAAMPGITDYVLPGDANRDTRANVYDLLPIGVGHYTLGVPRPESNTDWAPQFAPNWVEAIGHELNYKHLDCDGNGAVNELDADVVLQHYSPIDTSNVAQIPGLPQVRLEFDQDTIWVNPNNPVPLEIKATLKVGSPSQPALGLYGMALAMKYPDYVNHNPDVNYEDDLFGSTNHLLWLSKDMHSRQQIDLGLSRKNGLPVSGYGRVANISFSTDVIIIIDIIERGESKPLPFSIPVRGIKAIDKDGNEFKLSIPVQQDTIWIKTIELTPTAEQVLLSKVIMAPNPADTYTELYTSDLNVRSVEVLNCLGQKMSLTGMQQQDRRIRMTTQDWQSGVYTVRLLCAEGIVEKKLLVK